MIKAAKDVRASAALMAKKDRMLVSPDRTDHTDHRTEHTDHTDHRTDHTCHVDRTDHADRTDRTRHTDHIDQPIIPITPIVPIIPIIPTAPLSSCRGVVAVATNLHDVQDTGYQINVYQQADTLALLKSSSGVRSQQTTKRYE